MLNERWFKTCNIQKSIHPSNHSLPLSSVEEVLLRFHIRFFGIVTALNMSAMLWNASLLYTKDHLYCTLSCYKCLVPTINRYVLTLHHRKTNLLPFYTNTTLIVISSSYKVRFRTGFMKRICVIKNYPVFYL